MSEKADYSSSSDDDEWTRPSLRTDDQENNNNNNAENHDQNESTNNGEKKMVDYSWNEDEKALAGNEVVIEFSIFESASSGQEEAQSENAVSQTSSLEPMRFVMGVTIGHLKSFLENTYGYPYSSQSMFMNERELIDPLSLNDLGFQPSGEGAVNKVNVVLKK